MLDLKPLPCHFPCVKLVQIRMPKLVKRVLTWFLSSRMGWHVESTLLRAMRQRTVTEVLPFVVQLSSLCTHSAASLCVCFSAICCSYGTCRSCDTSTDRNSSPHGARAVWMWCCARPVCCPPYHIEYVCDTSDARQSSSSLMLLCSLN